MSRTHLALRGLSVLAIGVALAATFALTPATGKPEITIHRLDRRFINVSELNKEQAVAFVDHTGPTLVSGFTRGFSSVTSPDQGVYCLAPKGANSFAGRVAVASPEYATSTGSAFFIMVDSGTGACPNSNVEVHTYVTGQSPGEADSTGDASFMVIVPA